jgi:iron complex transport system permease protein
VAIIRPVSRVRSPWAPLAGLSAAVGLGLVAYVAFGGSALLAPGSVWAHLVAGPMADPDAVNAIVWRIRLPRACAAALVGAILGVTGAAFQGFFRNSLADPYVVGVSSGAAVGGTLAVLLGLGSGLGMVGAATLGGPGALAGVLALSSRRGGVSVPNLLTSGVVVGALLAGLTTLNLYLAGQDTNSVLRWLLGSTTPMYWDRVAVLAVVLALGAPLLVSQGRGLNAYAVDEFMAERLGVDGRRLKAAVLGGGALMVAVAVGSVGIVGFLGLVAPHLARRLTSSDSRVAVPASGLVGALLLLLADVLAQRARPGTELPLGAVTAVLGAPALLWLLRRQGADG